MSHERQSDRFNPQEHDWETYINASTSERDKDLRIHFVLNSVFAGLTESLRRKALIRNAEGLYIPSLSGKEPVIKEYSHLKGSPDEKFKTTQGKAFPLFEEYCISEQPFGFFSMLRTPVGKYGQKLAYDTVQAGRAMYTLINETMQDECAAVDERYGALLVEETDAEKSLRVLREAAQTTVAGFGLLTPTLVPGYKKDPMGLYRTIVAGKHLNRVASRIPLGHVIPMVGHGGYHPRPTIPTDEGTELSPEMIAYMQHRRDISLASGPGRPKERKYGCPGSRENTPVVLFNGESTTVRDSSVQQMAVLMLPYIEYFHSQPPKQYY